MTIHCMACMKIWGWDKTWHDLTRQTGDRHTIALVFGQYDFAMLIMFIICAHSMHALCVPGISAHERKLCYFACIKHALCHGMPADVINNRKEEEGMAGRQATCKNKKTINYFVHCICSM